MLRPDEDDEEDDVPVFGLCEPEEVVPDDDVVPPEDADEETEE